MLSKCFGPVINPGKIKKRGNISKLINEHGLTMTDNIKIADEFNKYFSSVGNQLAKEIKSNKSYKIYLKKCESYFTKNYRPISLRSILNKIIEKLVLKHIYQFQKGPFNLLS